MKCASPLTEFIPHKDIKDAPFVDLDAWCPNEHYADRLAKKFEAIMGVLQVAIVVAPAPGELPSESLVEAREESCDYFVDEAGDPNLFGKKWKVIVGNSGCSRCFMIGAACIADVAKLGAALTELHASVLSDPAYQSIESIQESSGKTAVCFHAAKDHPAIRKRVFNLLAEHHIRLFAVVRRKEALVRQCLQRSDGQRVSFAWQDEYDSMIARLFKDRLHLAKHSKIVIAHRGASDRTGKLRIAMDQSKMRFEKKWGVVNPHRIAVSTGHPHQHPGLQAVDYYMWALQRVFERGDFEFFNRYRAVYRLVVDVDDRRTSETGVYYSESNPISPEKIKPFEA